MKRTAILVAVGWFIGWALSAATGAEYSAAECAILFPKSEEFTDALNKERGTRGLRPVVYDSGLDGIAAANNAQQAHRGQGHWVTGGYGQCCYVGPLTKLGALFGHSFGIGYLQSASHAGLLLHAGARRLGIDQAGNRNTIVIAFDDGPVKVLPGVGHKEPREAKSAASMTSGQCSDEVKNGVLSAAACSTPHPCSPANGALQSTRCLAPRVGRLRIFRRHQ